MPTVLRTFPEIARVGHQETGWSAPIPATIEHLELRGVADDAVFSDVGNSMNLVLSVSPDGVDENPLNTVINREGWLGGTHMVNQTGAIVPNRLGVTFGPLTQYSGWRVKLAVDIPVAMVIGATVTSLP